MQIMLMMLTVQIMCDAVRCMGSLASVSKQTRMACRRTATDARAEKSGKGARGSGRAVSGAAAEEGRSAAEQTRVM